MLEINVTVSVPGLLEAINNLAASIAGTSTPAAVKVVQPETVPPANLTNARPMAQTPVVTPTAQPSTVTPPMQVSQPAPVANYSIEQLSIAGAALCEQGKMPQLIALLNEYGVQAITQLKTDPDTLNSIAARLKELGANL